MNKPSLDAICRYLQAGHMLEAVRLRKLKMHKDNRGWFTEFFRDDWDNGIEPVQWSIVRSEGGVLRGMHLHRRHEEFVLVIAGRLSVGLYDMRPGSPTEGRSMLVELAGDDLVSLSFPRGLIHGWYAHCPTLHIQSVSENYDRYGADDNLGCHWSDPALNIPWPERPTRVAPRAEAFPGLAELIEETLRLEPDFRYEE